MIKKIRNVIFFIILSSMAIQLWETAHPTPAQRAERIRRQERGEVQESTLFRITK